MPSFRLLSATLLLSALAACTDGEKAQASGNMTGGEHTAGGTGSIDTAGSAVNTTPQPTGTGTDTGSAAACCTIQRPDSAKKAP